MSDKNEKGVIQFDPSMRPEKDVTCRDPDGYPSFLFDEKFMVPEEKLRQTGHVAEAFFRWAEQYPMQTYWDACVAAIPPGEKPLIPYPLWRALAKQMIVSLVQKHVNDRDLPESEEPEPEVI